MITPSMINEAFIHACQGEQTYMFESTGYGAQVVLPKMPIPGVGWLVYCKDTEGNIFGMMQADPNAH